MKLINFLKKVKQNENKNPNFFSKNLKNLDHFLNNRMEKRQEEEDNKSMNE
jgi:hypothetical protein